MSEASQRRDLSKTPVHPALVRPILLAGVEREVAVLEMLAAMIVFSLTGPSLVLLFALLALAAIHAGLMMPAAQADPEMAKVYLRHIRYRAVYPTLAPLAAPPSRVPHGR